METRPSLIERLKEQIKNPDRATDSPIGKRKALTRLLPRLRSGRLRQRWAFNFRRHCGRSTLR